MLRTNLSTRPFYDVRAVHAALGAAVLIVVAFTLFNAVQIARLTVSQNTRGARAVAAEEEAQRLRAEAASIRARIDPQELQQVATAAREANQIIDRRAFSWTTLFAQFEATLPPDVRLTAIRPRLEQSNFVVSIALEARTPEDVDDFMEALEATGGFHAVLAVAERTSDEGLLQTIVEGIYVPPAREAAPGGEPEAPRSPEPATEAGRE